MNLWNEHGPDQWREPVTPDDTKEHQAIKLRVQTENAVSKRVSEAFQKCVKLEIAEKTSRSIYDALCEENPWLNWRLFEDCDSVPSEENTNEKIEVLYKNLFKGYDISLKKLESLKKKQQKFRSMIDINKFKEECMKDPILKSYDWREFVNKMFNILEKPSVSSYSEYFKLMEGKKREIYKNNKDFNKTEAILSNQNLRWRKEFKNWADKVFEVFYNLSSIEPIRTWEEAIDTATNIWMEEIFWEDTTLLPKNEEESKRISELSNEERLWEIMRNSEKIRSLKNITQEMKDKVREGIRNYYRSHITGLLSVDYYPEYELRDILISAWIDEKDIRRICPEKTSITINPVDYSICINGNYSSKII